LLGLQVCARLPCCFLMRSKLATLSLSFLICRVGILAKIVFFQQQDGYILNHMILYYTP
jgi:hypothetical protein